MCADCWYHENPGTDVSVLKQPEPERCCMCGEVTYSGIYIRRDPRTVPYPNKAE